MKCKLLILLVILLLPCIALADVHTVENEQLLLLRLRAAKGAVCLMLTLAHLLGVSSEIRTCNR